MPRNTGTAPKAPAPATWSARMAICGSQRRPKKNSCGGTSSKKAQASQSSEAMMPTVVRIATTEQAIMKQSRKRSTPVRARNRGERRARAKNRPASISASADDEEGDADDALPAAQPLGGRGDLGRGLGEDVAGGDVAGSRRGPAERRAASAPAVSVSGRLRQSSASITPFWNSSQSSTRISAGTPTQIATKAPW